MTSDVWQVMGVSANCSETELRRAYAVRLRGTNPEDDPEGFKRLRAAYEDALGHIRHRSAAGARVPVLFDLEAEIEEPERGSNPAIDPSAEVFVQDQSLSYSNPVAPPPQLEKWQDKAWSDQVNAFFKLENLIVDGASPEDIVACYQVVIRSEAMDRVDVHAMVEDRLADMLMRTYPKSEILMDRVISDFRWDEEFRQGAYDLRAQLVEFRNHSQFSEHDIAASITSGEFWQDYKASEYITEEDAAKDFINRVMDRRHEFFNSLREIERPTSNRTISSQILSFVNVLHVDRFITHVDLNYPILWRSFDQENVRWWRHYIEKHANAARAFRTIMFYTIALIMVVLAVLPYTFQLRPQFTARADCIAGLANTLQGESSGDCNKAADEQPDSIIANTNSGISNLQAFALDEASRRFDKVLAISPLDPMALYGRGVVQFRRGEAASQTAGKKDMQTAMALWPDVAERYANFGIDQVEQPVLGVERPIVHPPRQPFVDTQPTWIRDGFSEDDLSIATSVSGVSKVPRSGVVILRCYIRSEVSKPGSCQVAEESPPFEGLADVAISLMAGNSSLMQPATYRGTTINNFPVTIRVDFEPRRRDLLG